MAQLRARFAACNSSLVFGQQGDQRICQAVQEFLDRDIGLRDQVGVFVPGSDDRVALTA
jgi:hypothetical protein